MPRKNDYVALGYRVDALPRGMTPPQFFDALLGAVRSETGVLPSGLGVTLNWRNAPNQDVRSDDFTSAVRNSGRARGGFLTLLERRILRDAEKFGVKPESPQRAKRKAAAKKGWETRKKKAQEKEQAKQKRSAAAKKGWETRRANARKRSKAAKKGKRKR